MRKTLTVATCGMISAMSSVMPLAATCSGYEAPMASAQAWSGRVARRLQAVRPRSAMPITMLPSLPSLSLNIISGFGLVVMSAWVFCEGKRA